MKNKKTGLLAAIMITVLAIATLTLYPAFRTSAQTKDKPAAQKQPPAANAGKPAAKRNTTKMADVDQQDIDRAIKEVEESADKFKNEDWPKAQLEIAKAIKEIDLEKMQREIQSSLKDIDLKQVKAEVQKALAEVDKALKEVDLEKIKQEIAVSINKVDTKELEKQLAEVKQINAEQISKQMAEVKEQMAKMKIDLKDQFAKAGQQVKAAKKQLQLVKDGLDELEKDGLKKKGEKINIEFKEGILYLNGKAQAKEVSDKYSKYFSSGFPFYNNNEENEEQEKELNR
jgi:hypothetical protein